MASDKERFQTRAVNCPTRGARANATNVRRIARNIVGTLLPLNKNTPWWAKRGHCSYQFEAKSRLNQTTAVTMLSQLAMIIEKRVTC